MTGPETIIMKTKPSTVPIVALWPTAGTLLPCMVAIPALNLTGAAILGLLWLGIGVLIVILTVLRPTVELIRREFANYTLTDQRLIIEAGILSRDKKTIPVRYIHSVAIRRR